MSQVNVVRLKYQKIIKVSIPCSVNLTGKRNNTGDVETTVNKTQTVNMSSCLFYYLVPGYFTGIKYYGYTTINLARNGDKWVNIGSNCVCLAFVYRIGDYLNISRSNMYIASRIYSICFGAVISIMKTYGRFYMLWDIEFGLSVLAKVFCLMFYLACYDSICKQFGHTSAPTKPYPNSLTLNSIPERYFLKNVHVVIN